MIRLTALAALIVATTACVVNRPESECTNGRERCVDQTIERCERGAWEPWTDCEFSCVLTDGEAHCEQGADDG